MNLRLVGAWIAISAVSVVTTAATASPASTPRFSFSAAKAIAGDEVIVRVDRAPLAVRRTIRLYLVRRGGAATVRTRFDPRLSFIGSVTASRQVRSRLRFTVPPVDAGSYVLAYWCRGCLRRGTGVGIEKTSVLSVEASPGESCAVTKPNGNTPPGLAISPNWHGNGSLWRALPLDGTFVYRTTDATVFDKWIWLARGVDGELRVQYRRLDPPSTPVTATTIAGTLSIWDGPSWASRMYLQPGCWKVTGRVGDVSLVFVVQVVFE
jgi:hypothetical protein